jgi:diguanylate cyclase (GGDEF)-like protein
MDKAAAPERTLISQAGTEAPTGWADAQASLAASTGLALLLVAGHQPPSVLNANNNSVCQAFQSSKNHAHLCEPYCGVAHRRAHEAGKAVHYRCHAGLHCFAMPVDLGTNDRFAVIGGRAFLKSADYRALAERIRSGDLGDLLSADLFRNVIFALQQDLEELSERVREATLEFSRAAARARGKTAEKGTDKKPKGGGGSGGSDPGATPKESAASAKETPAGTGNQTQAAAPAPTLERAPDEPETRAVGGKVFPSAMTLKEASSAAIKSLAEAQGLRSLALMLRSDESFTPACLLGDFKTKPPRVTLKAKEIKLLQAATQAESIAVPAGGRTGPIHEDAVELFPLAVGDEIKGALLVADHDLSAGQRRAISAFCRDIAMPFEVLRLREELERRMRAATHLQAFTERINSVNPEEAYTTILRHSAELLRAERGSLMLFDETANELSVKAAVGPHAERTRESRMRLGDGVSGTVLREGRPVVVSDVTTAAGVEPAPAERSYKTGSFISYPITIAGRKVGVLNVTDKAGGGSYDEVDLGLLDMIAPQMALALDRAEWHQKATQFQLLSITDPLTGLLNRRYLEERLSEELERSKRHKFPMSFMMVDIDDFKNYNDTHGHQAGDLALEMTAQCLKSALRSADVASRYGGEEFSILLPQTSLSEAHVIAERIRRRVERTHFPHGKTQPLGAVTVSIGISAFGEGLDTPASIIYAADQALYTAKSRGKNCVDAFEAAKLEDGDGREK